MDCLTCEMCVELDTNFQIADTDMKDIWKKYGFV